MIPFEARSKRPGLAWLEFQTRRASQQEVERWFRHRRDASVGVVTGAISGIVVVDVDAGHDGSKPPLRDDEVAQVVDSVARMHARH